MNWASRPLRYSRMRTATRCTCATPTKRTISGLHPRESYLRSDRIIEVALRAKVDAIHPGYGFLAENPRFARAVAAADIAFVGPPAQVIEFLGGKVEGASACTKGGRTGHTWYLRAASR